MSTQEALITNLNRKNCFWGKSNILDLWHTKYNAPYIFCVLQLQYVTTITTLIVIVMSSDFIVWFWLLIFWYFLVTLHQQQQRRLIYAAIKKVWTYFEVLTLTKNNIKIKLCDFLKQIWDLHIKALQHLNASQVVFITFSFTSRNLEGAPEGSNYKNRFW